METCMDCRRTLIGLFEAQALVHARATAEGVSHGEAQKLLWEGHLSTPVALQRCEAKAVEHSEVCAHLHAGGTGGI